MALATLLAAASFGLYLFENMTLKKEKRQIIININVNIHENILCKGYYKYSVNNKLT